MVLDPSCSEWPLAVWPSQWKMEIPGGGGTSLDIPPKEVLGVVTPPQKVVIPYPRVCSIIWLHEVGGVIRGTPAHLQFVPR